MRKKKELNAHPEAAESQKNQLTDNQGEELSIKNPEGLARYVLGKIGEGKIHRLGRWWWLYKHGQWYWIKYTELSALIMRTLLVPETGLQNVSLSKETISDVMRYLSAFVFLDPVYFRRPCFLPSGESAERWACLNGTLVNLDELATKPLEECHTRPADHTFFGKLNLLPDNEQGKISSDETPDSVEEGEVLNFEETFVRNTIASGCSYDYVSYHELLQRYHKTAWRLEIPSQKKGVIYETVMKNFPSAKKTMVWVNGSWTPAFRGIYLKNTNNVNSLALLNFPRAGEGAAQ